MKKPPSIASLRRKVRELENALDDQDNVMLSLRQMLAFIRHQHDSLAELTSRLAGELPEKRVREITHELEQGE